MKKNDTKLIWITVKQINTWASTWKVHFFLWKRQQDCLHIWKGCSQHRLNLADRAGMYHVNSCRNISTLLNFTNNIEYKSYGRKLKKKLKKVDMEMFCTKVRYISSLYQTHNSRQLLDLNFCQIIYICVCVCIDFW